MEGHQKSSPPWKTFDFRLRLLLLLLLERVKHSQSSIQHYPTGTETCTYVNLTSEAGSPFSFKLPPCTTVGHMRCHQVALAGGGSGLPNWMAFRRQTGSLVGLALTEDCGVYHLKVTVIGEQQPTYFYLHIVNTTVAHKNSTRNMSSCSEGEIITWADLILQLNPAFFDASQRIHLVHTIADHLCLPLSSVYMFSGQKSFTHQQEELQVCRQGWLTEKIANGNEKQDVLADVTQLVWHVGCQAKQQRSALAKVLEHSVTAGGFAKLLEAPILGWRVLCISGVVKHRAKRGLQGSGFASTLNMITPPTHTHHIMNLQHSHIHPWPLLKLEPSLPTNSLHTQQLGTRLETVHPKDSTLSLFQKPEEQILISTVRTFVKEPSAPIPSFPQSTLHGVYPFLPLTPGSFSVTSRLTREAIDRKLLATSLTLRPHPKKTPFWTSAYRAGHSDSESPPTLSSLGHFILNQGSIEDHHTANPTLYNLPSVSHLPLAEQCNDVLLLSPRLKSAQSPPPSNTVQPTLLFSDVSPTASVTAEHFIVTQHPDTIQHLSSLLNQDAMPQLNVTTQDASATTLTGPLTPSGEVGLEPSLSTYLLEPSVTAFTPALPSMLDFFSGQLGTSKYLIFPEESHEETSMMHPMEMLMADISVPCSLQKNFQSSHLIEMKSETCADLCLDQSVLMQTLGSDHLLTSLQSSYPFWPIQMSLPLSKTHHIISVSLFMPTEKPFNAQPSVKPTHASTHALMPSTQQTVEKSQHVDEISHILSVTGVTASMYASYPAPPPSVFGSSILVSQDNFDPTAPSAVQEPCTTTCNHQIRSLDPSYPLCGLSSAKDSVYVSECTPKINNSYLRSTIPDNLISVSQSDKSLIAFQSQFVMFNSSDQLSLTQTSNPTLHPLGNAATEINHQTAAPQKDNSDSLSPLEDSGFSVITSLTPRTSALSGECVWIENSLSICPTDGAGPITGGHPTQQILSTSLSPFHGMLTTLLTSAQAGGQYLYSSQSTIKPTSSSASASGSINLPPIVLQSIPVLMAIVGFPFIYSIPPKTFMDPEDGEADALSLEIRMIDGPPASVGTWLALDGLDLHGVPLELDLQFAPQHLLLVAQDRQGLTSWLPLTVDLRRSPVDPCHIFTLTVQRSLYSILRHRHRVELLLEKLSGFFNGSSKHHLSVVSMRPGSTVVSWYDSSLCGTGLARVRQCHVEQIRNMWSAMRSEDGTVNPAFSKWMLPEFPIVHVGPVSYRPTCLPSTPPPAPSDGSTPAVHSTTTVPTSDTNTSLSSTSNTCVSAPPPPTTASSQQTDHHQWMAGVLTALLVVCFLILIVLLITTILHFCKGYRRSRMNAIWPAGRVLSIQRTNRRALRPRRPRLLQLEQSPPPIRLWINLPQHDKTPSVFEQREKAGKDQALRPRPPQYDFSSIHHPTY